MESIRRNCEENFNQIAGFISVTVEPERFRLVRNWVYGFIASKGELLEQRVRDGYIRDCNGDIHAENICLTDRVYIFDCIEFNNRFRYSDTAADIAFLLMDLDFHGASCFLDPFIEEYVSVTNDSAAAQLLDFYKVYRAMVRCKVESFRLNDPQIPDAEKMLARERATRYFRLASRYVLHQKLGPTLFVVCGLTGSGKSTLARELAFELGLPVVSSDPIRKEITGHAGRIPAEEAYKTGIYSPEITARTYQTLFARARETLDRGKSVILDATFSTEEHRRECRRIADTYRAPVIILQTVITDTLARERLEKRQAAGTDPSDGRYEIFLEQQKEFEPVSPEEGLLIIVDSGKAAAENVREILGRLELL